jgi:hypothetical protein
MPLPPRLFPGDEELGKRDDDHKPGGAKNPLGLVWQHRRMGVTHGLHRRTLKRAALGILGLVVMYYFFKNMPTDVENRSYRPQYKADTRPSPLPRAAAYPAIGKPPKQSDEAPLHNFNGPIKFYDLAGTLHTVHHTRGFELINTNVVCTVRSSWLYPLSFSSYSQLQVLGAQLFSFL